jgi:hypothetical protein
MERSRAKRRALFQCVDADYVENVIRDQAGIPAINLEQGVAAPSATTCMSTQHHMKEDRHADYITPGIYRR